MWDAKPDLTWHGHVTQAPTTVANVGSRNVGECLISVDDAHGDLLPNTNVTVTVTTLQHADVLSLPREALHTEGSNSFVYRVVDEKLVRTPVHVGVVNLTRVEITGGLKQGEMVALGATTDTDLQKRRPRTDAAVMKAAGFMTYSSLSNRSGRLGLLCRSLACAFLGAAAFLHGAQSRASSPTPRPLAGAEKALLDGRADAAVSDLQGMLAADPANGRAHLLLCRVYLSEDLATEAVTECQAALANGLAGDSAAQDWTGRALGFQAQHAGMLAGMKLALQVRTAFETAVNLAPASESACVDLGEYYTTAPAIVGGGNTRALALAGRIEGALPAVSHRIRAMAAERDKDFETAEREFQSEAAAGHTPGALVDLAAFYGRRHDDEKAVAAAQQTIAADRNFDATVVEAASVLDDAHQTQLAEEAMRGYLARGEHSDTAPAFRVLTTLGSLQARTGEKNDARVDFQKALALASGYRPAQKGLGTL